MNTQTHTDAHKIHCSLSHSHRSHHHRAHWKHVVVLLLSLSRLAKRFRCECVFILFDAMCVVCVWKTRVASVCVAISMMTKDTWKQSERCEKKTLCSLSLSLSHISHTQALLFARIFMAPSEFDLDSRWILVRIQSQSSLNYRGVSNNFKNIFFPSFYITRWRVQIITHANTSSLVKRKWTKMKRICVWNEKGERKNLKKKWSVSEFE